MPDINFCAMIIAIALVGAAIGCAITAIVMLAWPWLWALAKPMLHAATA